MSEFYLTNDRIAGDGCNLFTRKPVVYSKLVEHPVTGKPCILVDMSRNASAEIVKEVSPEDAESLRQFDSNIHLNCGDKLRADTISVHILQRRPLVFSVSEGATHTHGGHFASTKKNTLCAIRYPFEHILSIEAKISSNRLID